MSNHTNRSDTTSEGPPEKKSSGAVPTSSPVPAATEAVTIQRHSSRFQEADSAGEDRQPSPFVPDDAGGYETTTKVLLKYPEGCKTKSQEFIWPHGGEEVKLTGDFVRWGQGLLMDPQDTRTDEGANSGQRKEFRKAVTLYNRLIHHLTFVRVRRFDDTCSSQLLHCLQIHRRWAVEV